jgi:chromosome segregation ATPase
MTILSTIRQYLPSPPGSNRRRIEALTDEIRQVRAETRRAQDRIADAIVPLARVSEHFPLLRRELDEFVQSLSLTLRQASDRIRELDERLDEVLEQTRAHGDALGLLQSAIDPERALLAPRTANKEVGEQFEALRSAVDRLAVATTRSEALIEELLDRPQQTRDHTTWYVALLGFGFAAIALALGTMAFLR